MNYFIKHSKTTEHTVFWLFIWFFIFDYYFIESNWAEAIGNTSLEVFSYATLVYFNLLVLIPSFLKKEKQLLYFFTLTATIGSYVFLLRTTGLEKQFYEFEGWRNVFSMVLNTSLFLLISLLYWYFKQWQVAREQQLLLQSEKLQAELNFLRSQISPHFLFNTLNNIYALALQKHDNAAPMVAKLALLLRNMLYDNASGQALLQKEIEMVKQYIELNLLRKPHSANVDFYAEGDTGSLKIVPMLLLNFTENCFKHSSIDNDENAYVKIGCEIGKNGFLIFTTENSNSDKVTISENRGIGLQNACRQLELNYPDNYKLEINNELESFKIKLTIQLKEQ